MKIAVIIPFRGDAGTLSWALEGFCNQILGDDMELEVRLCGDGVTLPALPASRLPRIAFHSISSPRVGISEAKNILLRDRPADVVLFANGDTRPEPDMVRIHTETLLKNPPGTMVLGSSPWEKPQEATVFDALLSDTPMVFFYNQLVGGEWYDFRHAWNLNVSVRYDDAVHAGGFEKLVRPVYYDDLVLSHRLLGSTKKGVFYQPKASSLHRHPTTLEQYLNREELLGLMLPVLAKRCPDIFRSLHGDRSIEELADEFRRWVAMDVASHRWVYQRLQEWATLPESSLGTGADATRLKLTIHQMHIPLKRFAFRHGVLRGLELVDDVHWEQRGPTGVWRQAIG